MRHVIRESDDRDIARPYPPCDRSDLSEVLGISDGTDGISLEWAFDRIERATMQTGGRQ